MVMSTISSPKSFNPVTAKETSTTQVTEKMFVALTRTDGVSGEVKPQLARDWSSSRNGRVWEFTLRDGLTWSDGEPLDAEDVVFTFEDLHLNPDVSSTARFSLLMGDQPPEVEALSDTRIRFTYPDPYAPFPRATGMVGIMPEHVLSSTVEDGDFNTAWSVGTDPDSIVVNGPFELEEYQSGQRVVLERNEDYYETGPEGEPLPRIEELTFEIVKKQSIAIQKFLEGEIDVVAVPGKDLPLVQPREAEGNFTVYDVGPGLGTTMLSFNMNTDTDPETGETYIPSHKVDWFNDPAFRRAVSHGIARQEIIDIVMNGKGSPLYSPVSPANKPFYSEDVQRYPHDVEKAREILSENGYRDRDDDGIREGPDGNPVQFVLNTNSGNGQRIEMSEIIRKDLQNLGMDVSFSQLEFNTLTNKLNSNFNWEAIVIGFTGSVDPHFGSNLWLSSGDLHLWHPRQETPHREWEREIDTIFRRAVKETDREKRRELYDRWQRLVSEVQPVIFTVKSEVIYAVRDKYTNVNPTPIGGFSHNLEKIGVKN